MLVLIIIIYDDLLIINVRLPYLELRHHNDLIIYLNRDFLKLRILQFFKSYI